MFTVLSRIDINKNIVDRLAKPILGFMHVEDILSHLDIKELGKFIERYGDIFKKHELHTLLKHAVDNESYSTHKYENFLKSLAIAHNKFYPNDFIEDKSLIKRALANATNDAGRSFTMHLVPLYNIVDSFNKDLLLGEWEKSLDESFNDFLFIDLLHNDIIKLSDKDYLLKYATAANKTKFAGYIGLKNGKADFKDLTMINFIYQIYCYDIDFESSELKIFQNLAPFEEWALNPVIFDYTKFDPEWLLAVDHDYILTKLANINDIKQGLERYLKLSYNEDLSKIYFTYF